jgi:putative restriction endonuclease
MPKEVQRRWTREEFILVFNLYLQLPFGKLDKRTKEVQELASVIDRTPSSVAFVLTAFAGVDPYQIRRGISGTKGSQKQCKPIFDEFINNRDELYFESERILAERQHLTIEEKFVEVLKELDLSDKKGEVKSRMVKTRVNQHLFRRIVLNNYGNRCAVTGIDQDELLRASHIIPWAENEQERLNPMNGLCLSSLYDAAFDKFLISVSSDYKIVISPLLQKKSNKDFYSSFFGRFDNQEINLPNKYLPNKDFLSWHFDRLKV